MMEFTLILQFKILSISLLLLKERMITRKKIKTFFGKGGMKGGGHLFVNSVDSL